MKNVVVTISTYSTQLSLAVFVALIRDAKLNQLRRFNNARKDTKRRRLMWYHVISHMRHVH